MKQVHDKRFLGSLHAPCTSNEFFKKESVSLLRTSLMFAPLLQGRIIHPASAGCVACQH